MNDCFRQADAIAKAIPCLKSKKLKKAAVREMFALFKQALKG